VRALNLFPDEAGVGSEHPVAEVSETGVEPVAPVAPGADEGNPFFRSEPEPVSRQKMLAMDGIELPQCESLDALPSESGNNEESSGQLDEFSDDPDQLWFDETVTTMFMEDADKPKIETAQVEPRMETRAWPVGAIADGIDPAFLGIVKKDENAGEEIETAAQLEAEDESASSPTLSPDTFLVTAKDEVTADSGNDPDPIPIKPRPIEDVPAPAPAQELPFAAMLDAVPAGESGKRGFGVKLAPGWKPLRDQKAESPSKTLASSAGTDDDVDDDAASEGKQELVEATLRAPRRDSILDGFGEFLEEQVILSAAIDEPDFKAMAPSFDNRDAGSSSPDTDWQPTSLSLTPDVAPPEPPMADAPPVKTGWLSESPADIAESKPQTLWVADSPESDSQAALDRDADVVDAEIAEAEAEADLDREAIKAGGSIADATNLEDEPTTDSAAVAEKEEEAGSNAAPGGEEPKVSTPAPGSDALPKSPVPISAPSLVADNPPRGFSASLLYGAQSAGSFFDDLEGDAASVVEDVENHQPTIEDVAPVYGTDDSSSSVFPESVEPTEVKSEVDSAELKTPWSAGNRPQDSEKGSVADADLSKATLYRNEAEVSETENNVSGVIEKDGALTGSAVEDIPVSSLGYSHRKTNPALIKLGVSCPSCGVKLQIQARYLNIEGKCPGCSEMIVARQRGVVDPVVELATGRFPSFDRQPDLEPSDVPGGTVLSRGAVDEAVTTMSDVKPAKDDPPATSYSDPFSNPNQTMKKVRDSAAGGVWGPMSGKGQS